MYGIICYKTQDGENEYEDIYWLEAKDKKEIDSIAQDWIFKNWFLERGLCDDPYEGIELDGGMRIIKIGWIEYYEDYDKVVAAIMDRTRLLP